MTVVREGISAEEYSGDKPGAKISSHVHAIVMSANPQLVVLSVCMHLLARELVKRELTSLPKKQGQ